jgi:hypothetical protein
MSRLSRELPSAGKAANTLSRLSEMPDICSVKAPSQDFSINVILRKSAALGKVAAPALLMLEAARADICR